MVKGIIFDMDGVLVDNRDIHLEAFVIFCRRYGIDFKPQDILPMFGKGNDEILPALLPEALIEEKGIQALADEKEEIYREIFKDSIEPNTGLVDFLIDVRSRGVKCAVGSSGSAANVGFVLEKCGITDMFETVVNGDMVKHAKPDPEIFLLAAKSLGLDTSECLVIEDAFAGIEAANRAGIKVIGMATTYTKQQLAEADTVMLVNNFKDLSYRIVESL